MAQVWSSRVSTRQPLTKEVWLGRNNQFVSLIVGGVFPAVRTDYQNRGLTGLFANSTQQALLGSLGGANYYVRGSGQVGLVGRSTAGGSAATHHHTILILASNVGGSSFIYDSQSDGLNNHDIRLSSGNLQWLVQGQNLFSNTTVPIPSTGLVTMVLYSGQYLGANPFAVINGTTYTGTAANQDSFYAPGYSTWFGSSAFPAANTFSGTGIMVVIFQGRLSDDAIVSLRANPWQIFAPERQASFNYLLPSSPSAVQTKTAFRSSRPVRTTQPQGPVSVDWNNSITNGLAAITHAPMRYEAVSKRIASTSGPYRTAGYRSRNVPGIARQFLRSSNQSQDLWPATGTTGDVTLLVFGTLYLSSSSNQKLCRLTNSSDADIIYFGEQSNNAMTFIVNPVGGGGTSISFGSPSIGSTTLARMFVGRISGTAVTAWLDGRQSGSSTIASNNFSTIARLYNGSTAFLEQPEGVLVLSAYWKRALTDAEIQGISINPWQLFAPTQRIIYSLASVKPSLSAPAATSITNTTATPQVTLSL